MNPALWALLGGAAATLLVLTGAASALALTGRRGASRVHSGTGDELASARAEVEALRARLDELTRTLDTPGRSAATVPVVPTEFVITTAGQPGNRGDLPQVPDRAVLSVTLGEPLVKIAAFAYGVRRALSPENRNRIAFEMRREVKRARKERRRAARRVRATAAPESEAA